MKVKIAIVLFAAVCSACTSDPEKFSKELQDGWKIKLADGPDFASPSLSEKGWNSATAGKTIVQLGYPSYDSIFWYRYKIILPKTVKDDPEIKKIQFFLGRVDDKEQVYFNGTLLGSNNVYKGDSFFYSGPQTNLMRVYEIAVNDRSIRWDKENTIAIRVYDGLVDGGLEAIPFVCSSTRPLALNYQLAKTWKFKAADSLHFAQPSYNDANWKDIKTGSGWEAQGTNPYDGMAWYRARVKIPDGLIAAAKKNNSKLTLCLGKIDDLDEVFLNGVLIGENAKNMVSKPVNTDAFIQHEALANRTRYYTIDQADKRLNLKEENVLAIRVFDKGGGGGLYGIPYIKLTDADDGLEINDDKLYTINKNNKLDTMLFVYNRNTDQDLEATVYYKAVTTTDKAVLVEKNEKIIVHPLDTTKLGILIPFSPDIVKLTVMVRTKDKRQIYHNTRLLPFVLKK